MVSFRVIMFQELSAGASQRGFAEEDQLGETLSFDRPYPAFSKSIQIRTAGLAAKLVLRHRI